MDLHIHPIFQPLTLPFDENSFSQQVKGSIIYEEELNFSVPLSTQPMEFLVLYKIFYASIPAQRPKPRAGPLYER